jgi:hypothetical protein
LQKQRDVTTQRYDSNLFEYFSVIDCFKEEIGIYFYDGTSQVLNLAST